MADYILQYDREKPREVTEAPREAGSTAPSPERQLAARTGAREATRTNPRSCHEPVAEIVPLLDFQEWHSKASKSGSFGCGEPVNLQRITHPIHYVRAAREGWGGRGATPPSRRWYGTGSLAEPRNRAGSLRD